MVRWSRLVFAGLAICAGVASCKSSGVALSVDLRTDYVPGREIGRVVTEVVPDGSGAVSSEHEVTPAEKQFVEGARIADFGDLPKGSVSVKVKVLSPDGNPLVERLARVTISGDYALTVVITRSCEGIVCPEPGGDATASTCDRGKCVRPECTVVTSKFCAPPECSKSEDCKADVDCVTPFCAAGTCLFVPNDAKCKSTQTCDVARGCTPPDGPACTPTSSAESKCDDGVDDDCDGKTDCADPDCEAKACEDGDKCTEGEKCSALACAGGAAKSCDDGNACTDDTCDPKTGCSSMKKSTGACSAGNPCTENDTCVDGVCTPGTAKTCDDMNPCTTDTCDATAGCKNVNNTGPCDDGTFCNGADTCKDGTCQVHPGNPCGKSCDELIDRCVGCLVDADCGPVTYSAWGACGGFASTCDESGTQSRTVTTPKCGAGGVCSNVVTTQNQACARNTDNVTCGATTTGAWSGCGGFATACDTTGTRSRTITTRKCAAGACAATNTTENGSCTRTVANGTGCGTGRYCCSGTCYARNDNNHCSSCGVNCGAGSSCVGIGGGNYSCTCSSNAQCQSWGFGSGATCWAPSGQTVCNCQCTGGGCCSGASCFKPSGINYCDY